MGYWGEFYQEKMLYVAPMPIYGFYLGWCYPYADL